MKFKCAVAVFAIAVGTSTANGETPEEWIKLGARVHGAFGAFIPVGIRIGLDALERLKAEPRGLVVVYYNGEKPPCPCIADGIMIATQASPGQGTLNIAHEKAPAGVIAMIVIRDRKTGEGLRYTIADEWLPTILEWNKTRDPAGRYEAAMRAEDLFKVSSDPTP
ncbi:MAG: formylmethanofuran dehydrogenase subunit E family protein [Xanthobacteraceae bacterium]